MAYDDLCCQSDWRYECTNWQKCYDMPEKCLEAKSLTCLLKNCGACTGLDAVTPKCLECAECTDYEDCMKYTACSQFPSKCAKYQSCKGRTIDCRSEDCQGKWGPWSACSTTCGGGFQSSTFKITKEKVGAGKECEAFDGQVATQACQQVNECGKNEAFNALGSNRCSEHAECDGKRTCSEYGWCQGTSGCDASAEGASEQVQITMTNAMISSQYPPHGGFKCCEAKRALDGVADSFFHTNSSIGEYWSADFENGPFTIQKVRIQNRPSSEHRLGEARIEVDGKYCGSLPQDTTGSPQYLKIGKWYEVKCENPVHGSSITVTTTSDTFLHFSSIIVYGTEDIETTIRVYWHNNKGPNDGVQRSQMFNTLSEAEEFYHDLGLGYAKILVQNNRQIKSYGEDTEQGKCRQLAEQDGFFIPTYAFTKTQGQCRLPSGCFNSDDQYLNQPGGKRPKSLEECQDGCEKDVGCTAFHYWSNDPLNQGICEIFTEPSYAGNGDLGVDCYVKNAELQEFVKVGEGVLVNGDDYFSPAQARFPTTLSEEEMIEILKKAANKDDACVGFYYLNEFGRFEGGLQYDALFYSTTGRAWPPAIPQVMKDVGITSWAWHENENGNPGSLWTAFGDVTGASVAVNRGWNSWTCYAKKKALNIENKDDDDTETDDYTCSKAIQTWNQGRCSTGWHGAWQTFTPELDGKLESVVLRLSNRSTQDYSFHLSLKLAAKDRKYYNAEIVETSKKVTVKAESDEADVKVPFDGLTILKANTAYWVALEEISPTGDGYQSISFACSEDDAPEDGGAGGHVRRLSHTINMRFESHQCEQMDQKEALQKTFSPSYMGCFCDANCGPGQSKDGVTGTRDLPTYLGEEFTPKECLLKAKEEGFNYAGLQFGYQCFAGVDAPKRMKRPELECRKPCLKDEQMYCGNFDRNSVYKLVGNEVTWDKQRGDCTNNPSTTAGVETQEELEPLGELSNLEDCQRKCLDQSDCNAIQFYPDTKACSIGRRLKFKGRGAGGSDCYIMEKPGPEPEQPEDYAEFDSELTTDATKPEPPKCFKQGSCFSGFMDTSNNAYKYWACGKECEGGKYMTDWLCNCVCKKMPSSCNADGTPKQVAPPTTQGNTEAQEEADAEAQQEPEAKSKPEDDTANTSNNGESQSPNIPDYLLYHGCYDYCLGGCMDMRNDLITNIGTDDPASCFDFAYRFRSKGYKYVGMANGNRCQTGTIPPKREKRPDSECNMKCTKDETQNCGASNRISVYQIFDSAAAKEKAEEEAKAKQASAAQTKEDASEEAKLKAEADAKAEEEADNAANAETEAMTQAESENVAKINRSSNLKSFYEYAGECRRKSDNEQGQFKYLGRLQDAQACKDMCLSDPECLSVEWRIDQQECYAIQDQQEDVEYIGSGQEGYSCYVLQQDHHVVRRDAQCSAKEYFLPPAQNILDCSLKVRADTRCLNGGGYFFFLRPNYCRCCSAETDPATNQNIETSYMSFDLFKVGPEYKITKEEAEEKAKAEAEAQKKKEKAEAEEAAAEAKAKADAEAMAQELAAQEAVEVTIDITKYEMIKQKQKCLNRFMLPYVDSAEECMAATLTSDDSMCGDKEYFMYTNKYKWCSCCINTSSFEHYYYDIYSIKSKCNSWEHQKACVSGNKLKQHRGVTLEQCQALCDGNPACLGVEFFVESDVANRESLYMEGDCNESGSTDTTDCEYEKWQLEFWKKKCHNDEDSQEQSPKEIVQFAGVEVEKDNRPMSLQARMLISKPKLYLEGHMCAHATRLNYETDTTPVASAEQCMMLTIAMGRDNCPTDYFTYGGSSQQTMRYCLCCTQFAPTVEMPGMFDLHKIEPGYNQQQDEQTTGITPYDVNEHLVASGKFCKHYHKVSDALVQIFTCSEMTYGTNACHMGKGHFNHPGPDYIAQCYCCTAEDAVTNVYHEPLFNIYQALPVLKVYAGEGYEDPSESFEIGFYDIGELGAIGNDKLAGMIVPDELTATLFEHANKGGRNETFYGPYRNPSIPDWQNRVSGILVEVQPSYNLADGDGTPVGNGPVQDEAQFEKRLIERKWDWMHNGQDKNCDVNFREDGQMTGCGAEGTWRILDLKTLWADFQNIEHTLEFNEEATEAVLITPARNPPSRMSINTSGQSVDPRATQDMMQLKDRVVERKWDWLHNGLDKTCDCVFREDGTMTGCGAQGSWVVVDADTIWTRFHNIEHTLQFNVEATEAVLLTPMRDPQSRMRMNSDYFLSKHGYGENPGIQKGRESVLHLVPEYPKKMENMRELAFFIRTEYPQSLGVAIHPDYWKDENSRHAYWLSKSERRALPGSSWPLYYWDKQTADELPDVLQGALVEKCHEYTKNAAQQSCYGATAKAVYTYYSFNSCLLACSNSAGCVGADYTRGECTLLQSMELVDCDAQFPNRKYHHVWEKTKQVDCYTQEVCPVSCEGGWSDWSPCSEACGSGVQSQTYSISRESLGSGSECEAKQSQTRERLCNTQQCPADCKGKWSSWGPCSKECDSGAQTSLFIVTQHKVGAGKDCEGSEVEKCSGTQCNGYRGYQRKTVSGRTCQAWAAQAPHQHTQLENEAEMGLVENFCRNPDGESSIWCYTTDPDVRWELCKPLENGFVKTQTCNNEPCSRNCEGKWSEWSGCSKDCDSGKQTQTFTVTQTQVGSGTDCEFTHSQERERVCNTQQCVRDCEGAWSEWSTCSKECETGTQVSFFKITQQTVGPGKACDATDGQKKEQPCNTHVCPRDCAGSWSEWGVCSKACDSGQQSQTFSITEEKIGTGKDCEATHNQERSRVCNTTPCSQDCQGAWGDWEACSKACGSGVQSKSFSVTQSKHGTGAACEFADGQKMEQPCNTHVCPVDCQGSWGDWTACDQECGTGQQTRTFTVTQDKVGTGNACEAADQEVKAQECNTHLCSQDCIGSWGSWSSCSQACGTGDQYARFSVAQVQIGQGDSCEAFEGQWRTQVCNTHDCPQDCVGSWQKVGSCSAQCGGGQQAWTFVVTQEQRGTGSACVAANHATESTPCNEEACPKDCEGEWGEWSDCSVSCGSGTQQQAFTITQSRVGTGKACEAAHAEKRERACNTHVCPENCKGSWSAWSECSAACDAGTQSSVYTITKNKVGSGRACEYNHGDERTDNCLKEVCSKDCEGQWGEWDACSKPCDTGYQGQTFKISHHQVGNGLDCEAVHNQIRERFCNSHDCPKDCVGSWGAWSQCSAPCGPGIETQTYSISQNTITPGKECEVAEADRTRTRDCDSGVCPKDCEGEWGEWSECSCDAEQPAETQTFQITQPKLGSGLDCPFASGELRTRMCTTECPQDCKGSWSEWSECSKQCGTGSQWSLFGVTEPRIGTGKECEAAHNKQKTRYCNEQQCPDDASGPICCTSETAACLACVAGVEERDFCKYKPDTEGCSELPPQTAVKQCCSQVTASCVACTFEMPVADICAMEPDLEGCPQPEVEKPTCCSGGTPECLACHLGITQEEYCNTLPDRPGCSQLALDQLQGIVAQSASLMAIRQKTSIEGDTDEIVQAPSCCDLLTVQCLACKSGVTEQEYCLLKPNTSGCPEPEQPEQEEEKKPEEQASQEACCQDITASCLACQAGSTVEQYCAFKANTPGCKTCCKLEIAKCLACWAGWKESDYCDANPKTIGCPDADVAASPGADTGIQGTYDTATRVTVEGDVITCEVPGRPTATGRIEGNTGEVEFPNDKTSTFEFDPLEQAIYWDGRESGNKWVKKDGCCTLPIARCLACKAGVSQEDYCGIVAPDTLGCPEKVEAVLATSVILGQSPSPSQSTQEICCGLPSAKCLACQNGVKEIDYCELTPETLGCDAVFAAQKSLGDQVSIPEKNCLLEGVDLGDGLIQGDVLCEGGTRLQALFYAASVGIAVLLTA